MPAVAEVQFKAAGSQQVVTAFNSVGSAAQTSSTKIQQNSSAMKTMGQGMKSSISGIGQVTTAFATLSLSIVGTWRAYRDLGDAQIAVDKANLRVKKTTEAIRKLQADIAKDTKAQSKGGLDYAITQNKIRLAEEKLAKDRKDGKHSAAELRGEELALQKLRTEGVGTTKELADKQAKLGLLQEQLGVQTDVAKEAQERFNDTQQNFYLSIAPLAISTIGTLTTAFSGLKGMLTGGGGLIGGLGPIGLILGGITLAIIAFKTNFLGLRDAVGGVIKWLQERFGAWKDTIQEVFGFIQKGDWSGAFNRIKEAAAAFWEDLKKTVPLFGEVETLVNKIKNGNWKGALLQIWKAVVDVWNTIKKAVPFFGDIEKFINDIASGNWSAIPDAIMKAFNATLGKGIEWIFGKNWKAGLDAKIAEIQAEAAVNKRSVPLQIGITLNSWIKDVTGVDVAKWFTDHPITTKIPFAAGITMLVDDPQFQASFITGGTLIVQKLGGALTAAARFIDPYIADLITAIFSPAAWATALTAQVDPINKIGTQIITTIGGALSTAAADPNLTLAAMGDTAAGLWQGISDWFTTNLPETTAVIQAIAQNLQDSIGNAKSFFEGVGGAIWNGLIEGIKAAVAPFDFSGALRGALDKLKTDAAITIKPTMDTTDIKKGAGESTKAVNSIPKSHQTNITVPGAKESAYAVNTLHGRIQALPTQKTIHINVVGNAKAIAGLSGGAHFQHGYQGTVKRPTAFIAGEGGRPEDVTVRPRGSVQRGGSGGGGGGFYGTVNVYVDGVLRQARYSMGARK